MEPCFKDWRHDSNNGLMSYTDVFDFRPNFYLIITNLSAAGGKFTHVHVNYRAGWLDQ